MSGVLGLPVEALAFLGAVAAFLVILVMFYLFLNKKLCFSRCTGFLEQKPKKDGKNKLGSAYNYDQDTSSDSDDEVLRHYQEKVRKSPSNASMKGSSDPDHKQTYNNQAYLTEDQPLVGGVPSIQSGALSSEKSSSQFGETTTGSMMDPDEHLFDVSDLQDREPALVSKCGSLEVTFEYESDKGRMKVTVHQAKDIPTKDRGGSNSNQIRLLLLPSKKVRNKTKIKTGDNPVFDEVFTFKVPEEEAEQMGIRFRLYGCERMRRERMMGECILGFASINMDTPTTHSLTLEPRSNLSHGDSSMDVTSLSRSDSASSTQSMQHGGMPELLIGLAYNGTTGRLGVEVIKGSNFRNMAMNRAPDTYVKLTLMSPNGQEIARSKTSIRRGQPHPLFKETFMFQIALFQLPDVTLMVSVYNKRSMKRKEMIGWFSLGYNNSGDEELAHWNDMRESKGEQVCRWHVLLEA